MGTVVELKDDNFDQLVLKSNKPVLVDFWSPTCAPCRALTPILSELAKENDEYAVIAKLNITECPEIAAKYGISMLPTLLFFKNGAVAERMTGIQSQDKLQDVFDELDED